MTATTRTTGPRRALLVLAALALVATACGSDGNGNGNGNGNGSAAADGSGNGNGEEETAASQVSIEPVNRCDQVPDAGAGPVNRGAVVNMIEFEFCQDPVTIESGEAVEFVANGSVRHQVVHQVTEEGGEREFQSGTLLTGESFLHQFDTPGTYTYICAFHPDEMVGEIIVEA